MISTWCWDVVSIAVGQLRNPTWRLSSCLAASVLDVGSSDNEFQLISDQIWVKMNNLTAATISIIDFCC